MSRLRANQITNENANGSPNFPHGLTVTGIVTASSLNSTATQIVAGAGVTANSGGVDTVGVVTATSFKDKAGGTFVSNPTTTRGDVIVRGASANERLAIGSAGQVLKVNAGANGLEYGTVAQVVKKIFTKRDGARHSVNTVVTNNSYTSMWEWSNMTQTLTPQSNTSKFHITGMLSIHHYSDYEGNGIITYQPSGGTETAVTSNSQTNFRRTFRGSAGGNAGSNMMSPTAIDIMMEPNTASAVTFRIRLATTNSGKPWYVNRDGDNTTNTSDGGGVLSSWTITEVDGAQVTIASTDVDYYTS